MVVTYCGVTSAKMTAKRRGVVVSAVQRKRSSEASRDTVERVLGRVGGWTGVRVESRPRVMARTMRRRSLLGLVEPVDGW